MIQLLHPQATGIATGMGSAGRFLKTGKGCGTALCLTLLSVLLSVTGAWAAPLTGTKTICAGGGCNYLTLKAAIVDLNLNGVGAGGVTFTMAAGYTETFTTVTDGLITLNSTSVAPQPTAANPLVFQKTGAGTNPTITGFGGAGALDAVLGLSGTDYVTFDGINVAVGAVSTIEFGYALFRSSVTDGAQNNVIKNATVTLNKTNTNSIGIYGSNATSASVTALTVTNATGTNSNNQFFGNTVSNAYSGIVLLGSTAAGFGDAGNVVGTATTGNTISNIGGGSSNANGIMTNNQAGVSISKNNVNLPLGTTTTSYGILSGTSTIQSGNVVISDNIVSVASSATGSALTGIRNTIGGAGFTVTITNNMVQFVDYSSATSGTFYGIAEESGSSTASKTITGNTVQSVNIGTSTSTASAYGIYLTAAGSTTPVNISNNTVTGITRTGSGNGTIYGIAPNTGALTLNNNMISSLTNSGGTSPIYGIYQLSSPSSEVYTNNTINTLIHNGTGAIDGIRSNPVGTTTKNYSLNTIHTLSGAGGTVTGINTTTGSTVDIFRNKIYGLFSSTATGVVNGILITSGTTVNTYNNLIGNLTANTSTSATGVSGIQVTGGTTINLYYNTINFSNGGGSTGTAGIYLSSTSPTVDIRNNIVDNRSSSTGINAGLRRTAAALTGYASTSNNNLWNAAVLYYDGTTQYTTLPAFKAQVSTRESNSVTETPTYISQTGSNSSYLHLSTSVPTQAENGGQPISGITTDFDGITRSATTPDIGADEGNFIVSDITGPSISFTDLGNTASTANRNLAVTITDPSGVASGAGAPVLYVKKNAGAFVAMATVTPSSNVYTFTVDYSLLGGAPTSGDVFSYYLAAQDLAGNVSTVPSGGSGATPPGSTPPATFKSYTILPSLCGTKTVGVGGDYTTLTAAVAAYNSNGLCGALTFSLIDATYPSETFPITINQNGDASSTNTLTIKPASGVSPVISGSSTTAIITLNGADYVIIDGSNTIGGTSRNLTISNTAITGGSAAIFVSSLGTGAGATFDVIKNTNITAGSNTVANMYGIYAAGTTISLSGTGADNDNLTISNNYFTKTYSAIFVRGVASVGLTDNLVISNNTIGTTNSAATADVVSFRGVDITNATAPSITGNEIQNMITTISANMAGVELGVNVTNAIVSRNNIHDLSNVNASGYAGFGIYISSATGTSGIQIDNNVISSFTAYGYNLTFTDNPYGIRISGGTGHKVYFNSVNMTGAITAAAGFSGAFLATAGTNLDVRNNIFANSMSQFTGSTGYALYVSTGVTFSSINYNDYFVSGANKVLATINGTNRPTLADIQTGTGQDANSISADPLFNSATNLAPQLGSPVVGAGVTIAGFGTDYIGATRNNPPTIGAYETPVDASGPTITYTALGNTIQTTNRSLTGVTVTDASGVNGTIGTRPRLYYKRSTDANTFVDNLSTSNGWKYVEASGSTSPFSFTINYSLLNGGTGVTAGTTIQYFVVAQDLYSTPNVGINSGTFTAQPASVALAAAAFPIIGTINSYLITPSISGTIPVGTGQTYTSLTGTGGAFEAINNATLTGNVILSITSDLTEPGTVALNQFSVDPTGSNFRVTIKPSAATERVISGTGFANGMIRFNGADNVLVDGAFGGSGKYLRFRNTGTVQSPTFTFLNDAVGDTLRNSIIEGSVTSATSGTILFSTSSGTTGNDNNVITSNDIRDLSSATGVPANAVYSLGTAGITNSGNVISNNNIYNFTASGVLVSATGNGDGWMVTGNSFFQTAARTSTLTVISVQTGSGHTIASNYIGGGAASNGGTIMNVNGLTGISLAVGTTSATSVQGNTISNIHQSGGSTALRGIHATAGNVNIGTVTGNVIGGAASASDTIKTSYDADLILYAGSGIINIENNVLSNVKNYRTTSDRVFGIQVTGGTASIRNNSVHDLRSYSNSTTFFPMGIDLATSTAGNIVEKNTVYNLRSTNPGTASSSVFGIRIASVSSTGTPTLVQQNRVYNLATASTGTGTSGALVVGIYALSGSATYANNQVSIGTQAGTQSLIRGILDAGTGTNNYYYNTLYVNGATSAGTNKAYAFLRGSTATVQLRDNILYNVRTGGGGNFALGFTSATGVVAATSNYNMLYAGNTSATVGNVVELVATGYTLAGWQTATSADMNSTTSPLVFVDAANGNLNLTPNTNCSVSNAGTPITTAAGFPVTIATDYAGDARSATTPDIGSDEFATPTQQTATISTASPAQCSNATPSYTLNFAMSGGTAPFTITYTDGTTPVTITSATTSTTATVTPAATTTYTLVSVQDATLCTLASSGSAVATVNPVPTAFNVTGGGTACNSGSFAIGLDGSESGVNYQLKRGATNVGSAVSGTGSAFSFPNQSVDGTYTVVATHTSGGCTTNQTGSAVITINPLPAIQTMNGGGSACAGTTGVEVGLDGSENGVNYQLKLAGNPVGAIIPGNGSAISFGFQTTSGNYGYIATNATTGCFRSPSASVMVTINALPIAQTVTGGGNTCAGTTSAPVGLGDSQSGVNYELYLNGNPTGNIVAGTGSAISFGSQADGTYTVQAVNATTTCSNSMSGSVTVTTVTTTTWTGTANTSWTNPANWSNCVPTALINAIIPAGTTFSPVLTVASTGTTLNLTIDNGATLTVNGTLNIHGDLTNNGTLTLGSSSNVNFSGSIAQQITSGSALAFRNVTFDGSGPYTADADFTVSGAITMTTGVLTLNSGFGITLGTSATITESETSYILGNVTATRVLGLTNQTFGGLGIEIDADSLAPGLTTITRTTGVILTGQGTSESIERYFTIQSANHSGLDATVVFHYFQHELNGIAEADLAVFRTPNVGNGFSNQEGTPAPVSNQVTIFNVMGFGTTADPSYVYTLGDGNLNPLPVNITSFTAKRVNQDALVEWATAAEKNNAGFEVAMSTDSRNFRSLGFVNASATNRYAFTDREAGKTGVRYYRLTQVDLDGTRTSIGVRSVMFDGLGSSLSAMPNPTISSFTASVSLAQAQTVTLTLTDALGRIVGQRTVQMAAGTTEFSYELSQQAAGMYLLTAQLEGQVLQVKVVKQ